MAKNIDDMLDTDNFRYPTPTVRGFSGELHILLSRGLPDLCDSSGIMEVRKLADALNVRTQTVYKWMRNGHKHQLPKNQVDRILELSKQQLNVDKKFKQLQIADLWPFVTGYESHKGKGKKKDI